jgi:hypothetical protein
MIAPSASIRDEAPNCIPSLCSSRIRRQSDRDRAFFQRSQLLSSVSASRSRRFPGFQSRSLAMCRVRWRRPISLLPWLMFFRKREWLRRLSDRFDVVHLSTRPFSALSYMATGGIAHNLPVPHFLYRMLFPVDLALSRRFPHFCAAFFTVILTRR